MTAKDQKITATRKEVLALFAEGAGEMAASRPLTAGEIARYVSSKYPGSEWDDPYKGLRRTALMGLTREMAADGALIMRTGKEWREAGVSFYDQRDIVRYWTTPELAQKWQQASISAEQAARDKDRQETAERLAKGALVANHPHEYKRLVGEYLAAYDRAMSPDEDDDR